MELQTSRQGVLHPQVCTTTDMWSSIQLMCAQTYEDKSQTQNEAFLPPIRTNHRNMPQECPLLPHPHSKGTSDVIRLLSVPILASVLSRV